MSGRQAWMDEKALEVARRFTREDEPQRRAQLQVAVLEAMQMMRPVGHTVPAGRSMSVEDPPHQHFYAIQCRQFPGLACRNDCPCAGATACAGCIANTL